MKGHKLLLIVVCCLAFQACSNDKPTQLGISQPSPAPSPTAGEPPPVIAPAPAKFNRKLAGTIDGKLAIQMELTRDANNFYGRYFYEKNLDRQYLDLTGKIDPAGNVELTEMADDKETGVFTGKLISEVRGEESTLKFTGTWKKSKNDSNSLPFVLAERRYDLDGMKLVLKEQNEENSKQKFSIETSYPRLTGSDERAENFNKTISGFVTKASNEFRKDSRSAAADLQDNPDSPGYLLNISYETIHADPNVISLIFKNYAFTGGAHGNTASKVFNYDMNRGQWLKLGDLFQPNSNYLKVISDYCIAKIKSRNISDDDWIRNGAGPKKENYENWNITPQGLMITFDAYQVAAYAAGPQEIVVPYSTLKPIIKADGPLAAFVK